MTTYQERRERNTGIRFRTLGFMTGLQAVGGDRMPSKNIKELKKLQINAGRLTSRPIKHAHKRHEIMEESEEEEMREHRLKFRKGRY